MDPTTEKRTQTQEVEALEHQQPKGKGIIAEGDLDVGASIVQAQEDTHYTEEGRHSDFPSRCVLRSILIHWKKNQRS